MIQVQIDPSGHTDRISALVPLTDDDLSMLERALSALEASPDVSSVYKIKQIGLWQRLRMVRLDLGRVVDELSVAIGGRRDYYEEVSDMLSHRQGKS